MAKPKKTTRPRDPAPSTISVRVKGQVRDSLVVAAETVNAAPPGAPNSRPSSSARTEIKVGGDVLDSSLVAARDAQNVPISTPRAPSASAPGEQPPPPEPLPALHARLYEALTSLAFTLENLEDLCFRLGLDWDDIKGEAKSGKARSLIQACAAAGQAEALKQRVLDLRPHLAPLFD